MKITEIETFVVDAGWRPWQFVAIRTDEGLTGYGECSDGRIDDEVREKIRSWTPPNARRVESGASRALRETVEFAVMVVILWLLLKQLKARHAHHPRQDTLCRELFVGFNSQAEFTP